MRQVRVDFECRFWFPRPDGPGWGWRRVAESLITNVPNGNDLWCSTMLPPPMFSYNAVSYVRFNLDKMGSQIFASLDIDSLQMFNRIEWHETALWTQVKFGVDPPYPSKNPQKIWWLRWRTPDNNRDILKLMDNSLEQIRTADNITDMRRIAELTRRELLMYQLGGTVPRNIHHG